MKRVIVNADSVNFCHDIYAMGIVNDNNQDSVLIKVYEGGSEGEDPHVHVFWDGNCTTCVSLTRAEYAKHHDNLPHMHGQQKKKFIKVMSSPCNAALEDANGNLKKGTGYQYAVYLWVKSHEHGMYKNFNSIKMDCQLCRIIQNCSSYYQPTCI